MESEQQMMPQMNNQSGIMQQQQQQQRNYSSAPQNYYQNQPQQNLQNQSSETDYRTMSSVGMDRFPPVKMSGSAGNNSNLIRHSSSPAGLFNNINIENGTFFSFFFFNF